MARLWPPFRVERSERRNLGIARARKKGQSPSAGSGGAAGNMVGGGSSVFILRGEDTIFVVNLLYKIRGGIIVTWGHIS